MPFVANTPESLLARSDSKDPKSTCRGITSAGRPCRRPLGAAAKTAAGTSNLVLPRGRHTTQPEDLSDETLYCWQHKEQAIHSSARSSPGPKGTMHAIREERTSMDTLADRLGLVDLEKKYTDAHGAKYARHRPPERPRKPSKQKRASSLQLCCFTVPLEELDEPPKPRPRPHRPMEQRVSTASMPVHRPAHQANAPQRRPNLASPDVSPSKNSYQSGKSTTSITAQMKHLIPDTVDAATASALMTELAKPLTESDEAGYIYMFWLTPESRAAAAPVEAARSLLSVPSPSQSSRRASDAVSRFADQSSTSNKKTMLLKIGRAANVQRRMNQWQRQCGYDVEMLRYYPYTGDSSGSSAMTPHSKRVERLVHIELSGLGLRATTRTCDACGRDHREWFEVGAARDDVRRVDAVIRRWVEWDLQGMRVS